MSDHNPMIVRTDLEQRIGTKPFCFENSWLLHAEFSLKVQEIWNKRVVAKSAIDAWCIKMDRVKKFLKGWGKILRDTLESINKSLEMSLKS